MIGDRLIAVRARRRNAEEDLPPRHPGLAHQSRDDAAHHRQTVRLLGVEHAPKHGPPGLDVKDLGESLRVVARHHELAAEYFVEYAFALQQALRQLGIRHRNEGVQLRFVLGLVGPVHAARYHDAAGTNVQTEWEVAFLFTVAHGQFS